MLKNGSFHICTTNTGSMIHGCNSTFNRSAGHSQKSLSQSCHDKSPTPQIAFPMHVFGILIILTYRHYTSVYGTMLEMELSKIFKPMQIVEKRDSKCDMLMPSDFFKRVTLNFVQRRISVVSSIAKTFDKLNF